MPSDDIISSLGCPPMTFPIRDALQWYHIQFGMPSDDIISRLGCPPTTFPIRDALRWYHIQFGMPSDDIPFGMPSDDISNSGCPPMIYPVWDALLWHIQFGMPSDGIISCLGCPPMTSHPVWDAFRWHHISLGYPPMTSYQFGMPSDGIISIPSSVKSLNSYEFWRPPRAQCLHQFYYQVYLKSVTSYQIGCYPLALYLCQVSWMSVDWSRDFSGSVFTSPASHSCE